MCVNSVSTRCNFFSVQEKSCSPPIAPSMDIPHPLRCPCPSLPEMWPPKSSLSPSHPHVTLRRNILFWLTHFASAYKELVFFLQNKKFEGEIDMVLLLLTTRTIFLRTSLSNVCLFLNYHKIENTTCCLNLLALWQYDCRTQLVIKFQIAMQDPSALVMLQIV